MSVKYNDFGYVLQRVFELIVDLMRIKFTLFGYSVTVETIIIFFVFVIGFLWFLREMSD